ncbi:fumarylacetoacetate hydrolase family protein [soil metagenome]
MKLYKTSKGNLLEHENGYYLLESDWDKLINQQELYAYLAAQINHSKKPGENDFTDALQNHLQAPIGTQEVWAAGVTYLRSRDARMEESKTSGGADLYDKVYAAERPELFFKALAYRVSAHNEEVYIRKDSSWNVPEPELTLFINSSGIIQAYTIGNDMSSRSIEGENPLYLPQAKVYDKSAALGPCLYVPQQPISNETTISIVIMRGAKEMFSDSILLNRMKRTLPELASWLFRESSFANGCFLMTGTGMVPANDFTLLPGDKVTITIEGIGTLSHIVAERSSL